MPRLTHIGLLDMVEVRKCGRVTPPRHAVREDETQEDAAPAIIVNVTTESYKSS